MASVLNAWEARVLTAISNTNKAVSTISCRSPWGSTVDTKYDVSTGMLRLKTATTRAASSTVSSGVMLELRLNANKRQGDPSGDGKVAYNS